MSYEEAKAQAWLKLEELTKEIIHNVKFLADEYTVNLAGHSVLSLSCNLPPPEHITLLLHYLIKKIQGLSPPDEWITFRQLSVLMPVARLNTVM